LSEIFLRSVKAVFPALIVFSIDVLVGQLSASFAIELLIVVRLPFIYPKLVESVEIPEK
jgi:hypothetical protein